MDNFGKIYILMQRVRNNGYEYCNYDYSSGILDFVETKRRVRMNIISFSQGGMN